MSEIQIRSRQQQSSTSASGGSGGARAKAADKWLLANYDVAASIYTFSPGLTLADLNQNGDYRLLIGDIGFQGAPKLKVTPNTQSTISTQSDIVINFPQL